MMLTALMWQDPVGAIECIPRCNHCLRSWHGGTQDACGLVGLAVLYPKYHWPWYGTNNGWFASDMLVDQHGTDSLRYAMMYIVPTAMFIQASFM